MRVKVSDVARIWQAAGVSIIPILANQTKRPAFRWSPYQATIPTLGEVDEWWGNGKPYGLALICGAVSGNLEMTEVEGRACSSDTLMDIGIRMDEMGAGHIWDLLNGPEGYSEMSPSGGLHLLYRISDHEVPGNTKIANDGEGLVLAETRGHGGYVIVAPTPGVCHPSGDPWDLINGAYGKLPSVTWVERNLLHRALQSALGGPPSPPEPAVLPDLPPRSTGLSAAGLTPGDDYEQHTDWGEILEPHGWHLESRRGTERHWTRPGKDIREGASATTGRASDRDRLYVFSTSTVFQSEVPYTKFGAYALLNHNNDYSAAARELVRLGFGEKREVAVPDTLPLPGGIEEEPFTGRLTEYGNAEQLWQRVKGRYHWIHEAKVFVRWDGRQWVEDIGGHLVRELWRLTEDMATHAEATGDLVRRKWAAQSQNSSRITATLNLLKVQEGCTLQVRDFDQERGFLTVANGALNLRTGELHPHDPGRLNTRMFGASYDPSAECPEFVGFMEAALPDEEMRNYVQRALGYSLLGDVDQRSIFWIFGPPGTGKSTILDAMRSLFADYGATAAACAFRAKAKDFTGPQNELHALRGKRFVTTSETAESTLFDEDLLKRLSGRDQITSRDLYQGSQEWTPECALWLSTNVAPRFTTDDSAIWRRTKLIPFMTVFTGTGEVTDFARRILAPEQNGILNWLLAGLRDYLAHGLGEPESVQEMAKEQRAQSDSVARFIDEQVLDGILLMDPAERIRTVELFHQYLEWARQNGERALGSRRFHNRVMSGFPTLDHAKIGGYTFWTGLGRAPNASVLGTFVTHQPYLDN